jgi:GT2 family glycosyltransferase
VNPDGGRHMDTVPMQHPSHPAVAAVLVNWNGRDLTLECLRSLGKVGYRPLHLVVVDNGSTDGSVEAIRAEFPGVEVLPQSENLRFAGGNNVGIDRALALGSEHVLLLNNDTVVDPGFVEALVRRMEVEKGCGMVAPKIYYYDVPDMVWFAGGAISFWTGTMKHRGIREHDHGQYDVATRIDYATGCCILVRAAAIRSVGVLDESYFMYGEDADWSMRIRSAGYGVWYEPAAKVWHKLSVSAGGHLSSFKLRNKYLSSIRFFGRYARWYHWFTWPWLSIVVNVVAGVRYKIQTGR